MFGGTPGSSPLGQGAAQIKMVKTLVSHPHAKQGQLFMDNDLLLVELLDPLQLTSQIQAACVGSSHDRTGCVTVGWLPTDGDDHYLHNNIIIIIL